MAVLDLRAFGVAFGDNVVLRAVDLAIAEVGIVSLMGPGGAGKSTLVRTLAGHNDAQPLLRTWGVARYRGHSLGAAGRPFLLAQSARLMIASVLENVAIGLPSRQALTQREQRDRVECILSELGLTKLAAAVDHRVIDLPLGEQRAIAVARAVAGDVPLVLLDEPAVGLDELGCASFIAMVRRESERRAFVYVTHNRAEALALDGRVALLVAGRIVEDRDALGFFEAPATTLGRHFVDTGSCYVDPTSEPPPDSEAVDTPRYTRPHAETVRPPILARVAMPRLPRGLHWVRRGALCGMPRPGLLVDVEEDVAGLYSLGVGTLVSLEETRTVSEELLARYAIASVWLPIVDMGAPSVIDAYNLCVAIDERVRAGGSVAVHCRAGLGRTGTILAAFLAFEGQSALDALEAVRCVQPRFVQSDEQIEFLSTFAAYCRERHSVVDSVRIETNV